MDKATIGILAGMGPRSTTPFLDLVLDQCTLQYGAKYDTDFPPIIIYSLPTPFYLDRPIDHPCMESTIAEGLKRLESAGVSYIAMPCNSAHAYFDDLEKSINIPLLNIITETIAEIPRQKGTVTLLATPSTFDTGLYQRGIRAAGHEFVFNSEWQGLVNRTIQMIKMNENMQKIVQSWSELMAQIADANVDTAIIACTDLTVVLAEGKNEVNIIDSSECLAKATVRKYLELVNK